MSGIERRIAYGSIAVILAGVVWLWRRVEDLAATRAALSRDVVETETLRARRIIVSDSLDLVRGDGKSVGFLIARPGGGFLQLFDPDTQGSAHLGYAGSGDPTDPVFSVWAGLGDTGITLGTAPGGRRVVRTTTSSGSAIERVDYEFDGEKLARAPGK